MDRGNATTNRGNHISSTGGRRPALIAAAALSVILAACGNAGQSGHSSPSMASTASPTPVDVVSQFRGELAHGLTADATVSGTVDIGTVHGTMDGTYTFGGGGSYSFEITTHVGDSRSVNRGVFVDGTTYDQDGYGPWLIQQAPTGSPGTGGSPFDQVIAQLSTLRDEGTVTKAGQRVHLLQVPGGLSIPPTLLGDADPSIHDRTATMDFYAQDNGTPAGMTMTMSWTQGAGSTSVAGKAVMDLMFTTVGTSRTVTAPDDVWKVYTSKQQRFSVAYPGEWKVKGDAVSVSFTAPDDSAMIWIGLGVESKGMTQKVWTSAVVSGATAKFGRSDASVRVDVAGVATSAYEWHGKLKSEPVFFMDVPLMHGDKGYEIQWYGMPGYERDDLARFQMLLASFAFAR